MRGTVKVMSVSLPSRVFWMIMSTRMPASEMGRKILAAMPGWSGTVLMVMRASFLL